MTRICSLIGLLVVAGIAHAQAPDARYADVLGKQTFVEGQGFPGILVAGDPTPQMIAKLGYPAEKRGLPFWYFYEKGAFRLTVIAELDMATGAFRTRALIVEGEHAPATKKGVKIGDPVAQVTRIYGPPSKLDTDVGSPVWKNMVQIDIQTGARRTAPDADAAFANSLFYPQLSTLFVVDGGKVSAIGVVRKDEKLPVFLRESTAAPADIVVDAAVTAPKYVDNKLHVPPPPALEPQQLAGATVMAPKGWKRTGDVWSSADGIEKVEVRSTVAPAQTPAQFFAATEAGYARNNLTAVERVPPKDFCDLIGATEARALLMQEGDKGRAGNPLRHFVLMAVQGSRRFVVEVTRTATGASPSPDGEAFARGVMRGFKIR